MVAVKLNASVQMDNAVREMKLADLHDDFLRDIFNKLCVKDLSAVSQSCRRFDDIVDGITRERMSHSRVTVRAKSQIPVLMRYGKNIKSLRVDFPQFAKQAKDINRFCPNLKCLYLRFAGHSMFSKKAFPTELFSQLTELDIYLWSKCSLDYRDADKEQIGKIMRRCTHLAKLSLSGRYIEPFLSVNSPTLTKLRVYDVEYEFRGNEGLHIFREFVNRNTNLKSLELDCVDQFQYHRCLPDLMELRNFDELKVRYNPSTIFESIESLYQLIKNLHEIPTLRTLAVDINTAGIALPYFGNLKQLECLRLVIWRHDLNNFHNCGIFKLPNLSNLSLIIPNGETNIPIDIITSFVINHPQLKSFEISGFRRQTACKMVPDDLEDACKKEGIQYEVKLGDDSEVEWYRFRDGIDIAHIIRKYSL